MKARSEDDLARLEGSTIKMTASLTSEPGTAAVTAAEPENLECSEPSTGLDLNANQQSKREATLPVALEPTTVALQASILSPTHNLNIASTKLSTLAESENKPRDAIKENGRTAGSQHSKLEVCDSSEQLPPVDRFHLVYILMFILGVSSLLPWNFFITASQYFAFKLRNVSLPLNLSQLVEHSTSLQVNFASNLEVASLVPSLIFQILVLLIMERLSLKTRLVSSLSVGTAIFGVTAVLVKVDTDGWQNEFFAITMTTVVIFSGASAVGESSLLGLAATLPQRYTPAVMSGMGLGGVVSSLANILSLVASADVVDSAFWYFIFADIVIAVSLGGALILQKLNFTRYYRRQSKRRRSEMQSVPNEQQQKWLRMDRLREFASIFKEISVFACSVALVFAVTLAVFPGVSVNVHSIHEQNGAWWSTTFFVPLYCFLLFNVGDLVGRLVAGRIRLPKPKLMLPILTLCRVAFIPLFMVCNVQPRQSSLPVVLEHDAYPYALMALLSLTNGYLSTVALMIGPSCVSQSNTESAGVIMAVSIMAGLGMGSLISIPVIRAI